MSSVFTVCALEFDSNCARKTFHGLLQLLKRPPYISLRLSILVHMILKLDIRLASATNYDISDANLLKKYGIIETALRARNLYFMIIEINHLLCQLLKEV